MGFDAYLKCKLAYLDDRKLITNISIDTYSMFNLA